MKRVAFRTYGSMIRILWVFLTLLGPGTASLVSAQPAEIEHNGRSRTYLVHLPPTYDVLRKDPYPLILALHGGLGSADNLQDQSRLSEKADTASVPFVVVYPEGISNVLGIRTWNAGVCCGTAVARGVDDTGFITVLLDTLLTTYNLDPDRVFVTGMSNGGMMAYRLAAELSDRIAAIAPVASTMTLHSEWAPANPVPIVHFHSFLDKNVPFSGGVGEGFSGHYNPPVDSVLSVWSALNACLSIDTTVFDEPGDHVQRVWSDCSNRADINLYVTYDGGHSWPGGNPGSLLGDPTSNMINADNIMWSFFQDHPRTGVATSVQNPSENTGSPLSSVPKLDPPYPNPFRVQTSLAWIQHRGGAVTFSIYDVLGRRIRSIAANYYSAGRHTLVWDGENNDGIPVSAGQYFVQMQDHDQHSRMQSVIRVIR